MATTSSLPYNHYRIHNSRIMPMKSKNKITKKKLINQDQQQKKEAIPRISIIGVDKIFYDDYCIVARTAWLLILIALTSLSGTQLLKFAERFFSNPVLKQTDVIRNYSVAFPAIIICPGYLRQMQTTFHKIKNSACLDQNFACESTDPLEKFELSSIPPFSDALQLSFHDLWTFFDIAADIDVYTVCEKSSDECEFLGKKMNVSKNKIFTFWGNCVELNTVINAEYKGPFTNLKIKFHDAYYQDLRNSITTRLLNNITVNEAVREDIKKRLMRTKIGLMVSTYHELTSNRYHYMYFQTLEVLQGFETHIQLHRKEFEYCHRKQYPCKDENSVIDCYNNCFEEQLSRNCKMPYVRNESLKNCAWSLESVKLYLDHNNVYNKFNFSACNCPPKCKEIIYTMGTDVITELYDDSDIIIKFYFSDNTYDKTTERFFYGFVECLSDIGGNLGFFLGFCSLSVAELIEVVLYYFFKIFKKPYKIYNICKN